MTDKDRDRALLQMLQMSGEIAHALAVHCPQAVMLRPYSDKTLELYYELEKKEG